MGKKTQIFIIVLLAILTSCVNTQFYADYLKKVDSLNASLEASASSFEQIDTTKIISQNIRVKKNLDSLNKLQVQIVQTTINEYSYIKKSYKTILREYPLALKELQYSREQLTALKHDIENRHLEEEMIKTYFSQEEDAISLLKEKMKMMGEVAKKQMDRFDLLNPEVEMVIDSLSKLN